jgi:hypothetical protein
MTHPTSSCYAPGTTNKRQPERPRPTDPAELSGIQVRNTQASSDKATTQGNTLGYPWGYSPLANPPAYLLAIQRGLTKDLSNTRNPGANSQLTWGHRCM